MRILDLYCGAGGAAMGLHMAFPEAEIVGIDIRPQPRYPFKFLQRDVNDIDIQGFDFYWASPPCQCYSPMRYQDKPPEGKHKYMIPVTQEMLRETKKPYVIENVPSSEGLHNPITLCGTHFDLGVFRHRLFECSFPVVEPKHEVHRGVIGDGKYFTVVGHAGGSSKRDGWKGGSTEDWRKAMGIWWMSGKEIAEAIPPAYSYYIGMSYRA